MISALFCLLHTDRFASHMFPLRHLGVREVSVYTFPKPNPIELALASRTIRVLLSAHERFAPKEVCQLRSGFQKKAVSSTASQAMRGFQFKTRTAGTRHLCAHMCFVLDMLATVDMKAIATCCHQNLWWQPDGRFSHFTRQVCLACFGVYRHHLVTSSFGVLCHLVVAP